MSDPNQKPIMKDNVAFIDDWGQHISECEDGGVNYNGDTWGTTDISVEGSKGVVQLDIQKHIHCLPFSFPHTNATYFLGLDEAEDLLKELSEAIKEAVKTKKKEVK